MNEIKRKTAIIKILGLLILTGTAIFAGCSTQAEVKTPNQTPTNSAQPKDIAENKDTPEPILNHPVPLEKDDIKTEDINKAPKSSKMMLTTAAFEKIQIGMTLEEVEEIIGDKGMLVSDMDINGKKTKTYKWTVSDFSVYIDVIIEKGKVVEKRDKGLK